MKQLCVPENWLLAWASADNSQIRLACPACGGFSLLLTRHPDTGEMKSLACSSCDLAGLEKTQAAFNAWVANAERERARDQASLDDARLEGNQGVAVHRQRNTKKAA